MSNTFHSTHPTKYLYFPSKSKAYKAVAATKGCSIFDFTCDFRDVMGSFTNSSCGAKECKWKPRTVSAKRDFPEAFDDLVDEQDIDAGAYLEETNVIELNETLEVTKSIERKVSAERCFPPGCGSESDITPLSEEELDTGFIESKKHWLTCETCRDDDYAYNYEGKEEEKETYEDEIINTADNEEPEMRSPKRICRRNEIQPNEDLKTRDADLNKYGFGVKSSIREREIWERFMERVNSGRRPKVFVVRCWPPGCGPDAQNLSEEEITKALAESKRRKLNLTCNSCGPEAA